MADLVLYFRHRPSRKQQALGVFLHYFTNYRPKPQHIFNKGLFYQIAPEFYPDIDGSGVFKEACLSSIIGFFWLNGNFSASIDKTVYSRVGDIRSESAAFLLKRLLT